MELLLTKADFIALGLLLITTLKLLTKATTTTYHRYEKNKRHYRRRRVRTGRRRPALDRTKQQKIKYLKQKGTE